MSTALIIILTIIYILGTAFLGIAVYIAAKDDKDFPFEDKTLGIIIQSLAVLLILASPITLPISIILAVRKELKAKEA